MSLDRAPRLLVVTVRMGMIWNGGIWNLLHSRNLGFTRLGCELKMLCGLPADAAMPPERLGLSYPVEKFVSPLSLWRSRPPAALMEKIAEFRPDAILLSGDNGLPALIKTQGGRTPLWLDVHGSIREMIDYGASLKRRLVSYPRRRLFARRWYSRLDAALAVTDYLGEEVRRYAVRPDLPVFTVPCASLHRPDWDAVRTDRRRWRERLGIEEGEILIAHSGGLGLYQHPRPMLALLETLWRRGIAAKLLIATNKVAAAREFVAGAGPEPRSRVMVDDFSAANHLEVLAAADWGLLLRDDNATNRAAFPNKTDQFWSVGVPVITTPGLQAVARLIGAEPSLGVVLHRASGELDEDEAGRIAAAASWDEAERAERFRRAEPTRERISFERSLRPAMELLMASAERAGAGPG